MKDNISSESIRLENLGAVTKVLNFLSDIKGTMYLVKKYGKKLDMDNFTVDRDEYAMRGGDVKGCGTACCAAGWHSLFMGERRDWCYVELRRLLRLAGLSLSYVSCLFNGIREGRQFNATSLGIDPTQHPHLTLDNPSPNDVIEFIDVLYKDILEKEVA